VSNNRYRRGEPLWASYTEEELMDLRFRDLGLRLEGTELRPPIRELYQELAARGLCLRPPCWISSEWFSPAGAPGIAIPFYLAHPRLKRLEYRQMREVEGGTKIWLMQLLRHEAGHAYEVAYRLNRRKEWHQIFGRSSKRYPDYYKPNPLSKDFVLHLDWWYAQSHPVEDFAETFAVWLQPGEGWRNRYRGWPALKKLEYVDQIMAEIAGKPPLVKPGHPVEKLEHLRQRLREHYRKKLQLYRTDNASFYDHDLRRLFPPAPDQSRRPAASAFLRRIRSELPRHVPSWNSEHIYTANLVLKETMQRCRELGLRASQPESKLAPKAIRFLTQQTMHYLYNRKYRLAM
jgi:putative zinc-binding metallo-peptidase